MTNQEATKLINTIREYGYYQFRNGEQFGQGKRSLKYTNEAIQELYTDILEKIDACITPIGGVMIERLK